MIMIRVMDIIISAAVFKLLLNLSVRVMLLCFPVVDKNFMVPRLIIPSIHDWSGYLYVAFDSIMDPNASEAGALSGAFGTWKSIFVNIGCEWKHRSDGPIGLSQTRSGAIE